MKKSRLKTGMRVTTTGGNQYIVFLDAAHGYYNSVNRSVLVSNIKKDWMQLTAYDEDLTCPGYSNLTIDLVEIADHPYLFTHEHAHSNTWNQIWSRDEVVTKQSKSSEFTTKVNSIKKK